MSVVATKIMADGLDYTESELAMLWKECREIAIQGVSDACDYSGIAYNAALICDYELGNLP